MAGGKLWTKTECDLLVEKYPHYTNDELIQLFFPDRTPVAIQRKGNKLGLHKTEKVRKAIQLETARKAQEANFIGRTRTSKGYVLITLKGGKRVQEHRLVIEQVLGRKLRADEVVHHKNGDITDNRPENLEVMTNAEHTILHHTGAKRSKDMRRKLSKKLRAYYATGAKPPSYKHVTKAELMQVVRASSTVQEAFTALGISKRTFYNKLDQLNLREWYSAQ